MRKRLVSHLRKELQMQWRDIVNIYSHLVYVCMRAFVYPYVSACLSACAKAGGIGWVSCSITLCLITLEKGSLAEACCFQARLAGQQFESPSLSFCAPPGSILPHCPSSTGVTGHLTFYLDAEIRDEVLMLAQQALLTIDLLNLPFSF